MNLTVRTVLLAISVVCFVVAAAGRDIPRPNFLALGGAFLSGALLFP